MSPVNITLTLLDDGLADAVKTWAGAAFENGSSRIQRNVKPISPPENEAAARKSMHKKESKVERGTARAITLPREKPSNEVVA